ncbi:hypothetical protein [Azotobacter armeniacus]
MPEDLGQAQVLLADNGFYSQAHVQACGEAGIEPLLALRRESHLLPVSDASLPTGPSRTPMTR